MKSQMIRPHGRGQGDADGQGEFQHDGEPLANAGHGDLELAAVADKRVGLAGERAQQELQNRRIEEERHECPKDDGTNAEEEAAPKLFEMVDEAHCHLSQSFSPNNVPRAAQQVSTG